MAAAIRSGLTGAALRAGLAGSGPPAFTLALMLGRRDARLIADGIMAAAVVLVAEDDSTGKAVGSLMAYPPPMVIEQHVQAVNGDLGLFQQGLIGLAKIKAMAVDEDRQRGGIGAALLGCACDLFIEHGYLCIYGQTEDRPHLVRFYKSAGFSVSTRSTGRLHPRLRLPQRHRPRSRETGLHSPCSRGVDRG